ncbi:MAG: Holliday junction DNA helicase RuvA [Rhodospirillales bacterium RIFCSPLOWO2_12_FULL_58_28]|nr:MAG: Holliday junction DNA helicase RuvA [Rhodospirillales bacterium RIFCSPLOWO2_12_FULL_58_28]
MIAKLTGFIDSSGEGWAVVDVSGVGYLVFCSSRTLGRLIIGDAVSLFVETHVREDHIHLYGFMDESERDWFRLLTTVQGVGAKVSLAILSALGPNELADAIAVGDCAAVTRAAGVGPKLATRIISELKDKAGAIALGAHARIGGATATAPIGGAMADAVSALVNLGYGVSEAHAALARACGGLGPQPAVEDLIRAGLSELGAGEHRR